MTKKVAADKEGAGLPLPRSIVERIPESEPRRFYVLSADALPSLKPHNDECREIIRTVIERTLMGRARMHTYKDRVA